MTTSLLLVVLREKLLVSSRQLLHSQRHWRCRAQDQGLSGTQAVGSWALCLPQPLPAPPQASSKQPLMVSKPGEWKFSIKGSELPFFWSLCLHGTFLQAILTHMLPSASAGPAQPCRGPCWCVPGAISWQEKRPERDPQDREALGLCLCVSALLCCAGEEDGAHPHTACWWCSALLTSLIILKRP